MNTTSPSAPDHSPPSEHSVGAIRSIVRLGLPAAVWIAQLLIAYGLSSNACSSSQGRGGAALLTNNELQTLVLLGVNLLALAICIGAGVDCALKWGRTAADNVHRAPSAGEGRTRFIALCGMLAAVAFGVGILFNTVEPLMISHCWRVRP